jgi:threonine/homoserine/homoserine lactone efflux protein
MTFAAFTAAWFLHLLAAASPGPAVLMTARTGMTEGFLTGLWVAVGVALGAVFWAIAALFGLAVLFKFAPALLWGYKIAGGLYLIWIAWQMWSHAKEPLDMAPSGDIARNRASAFRLGLVTNLANPKPAVFFGAVFVGTVPPGTSLPWIAALLVMVFLNEAICNAAVARAFSFNTPRRIYTRLKTGIDRSFGSILAILGVKIAAT